MKYLATLFLILVAGLALLVSIRGFLGTTSTAGQVFQIMFVPITVFLFVNVATRLALQTAVFETQNVLDKVLVAYCLVISLAFVVGGFLASKTRADFLTNILFIPLPIYFLILVVPKKSSPKVVPANDISLPGQPAKRLDQDRRDFLKMIGAAGVSLFVYNLLFRGDPGSLLSGFSSNRKVSPLALKNAQGDVINPAEKSPTEGYSISQIDDSPTAYFGFVNNLGQWFIMRQDTDNAYRYTRGDKDFEANWPNRTKLDYDYFDNIF